MATEREKSVEKPNDERLWIASILLKTGSEAYPGQQAALVVLSQVAESADSSIGNARPLIGEITTRLRDLHDTVDYLSNECDEILRTFAAIRDGT